MPVPQHFRKILVFMKGFLEEKKCIINTDKPGKRLLRGSFPYQTHLQEKKYHR